MTAPFPSPTTKWHDTTYSSISPSRPELSAKGKTVVVTGGGSGIGAETARSFCEAGAARVALLGRREQPLLDTKASIEQKYPNVEVLTVSTDVTKKDQVDAAFAKIGQNGTKIDVLVSGAAVIGPQKTLEDVDADDFVKSIDDNVRGALNVAKAFLRYAAKGAVVIEINSSAAHINFDAKFAAYAVAKLTVFRLWDSLAFERPELNVYHTQPGVVDTDMNKEAGGVAAVGFSDDVSLPGSFNVWLASPEARSLKGKFVWTNWDVDELKARAKEIEETSFLNIGLDGWPFQKEKWVTNWKN